MPVIAERPAGGLASGLLILHHGRGADENDLLALAEALDPAGRLHVACPRAPLQSSDSAGYHWYERREVGRPEPVSFSASYRMLTGLHDALWERTGLTPEQTVLGGFSMGTVMSYALGLGADRPAPAGILALSGFLPAVDGWKPELVGRRAPAVLIAHGRHDPVIPVRFARQARAVLEQGGLVVDYRESEAAHHLDPGDLPHAASWLARTLALASS
jgi:phospholipase/carboxylesterase